jgi:hypothetical protein
MAMYLLVYILALIPTILELKNKLIIKIVMEYS